MKRKWNLALHLVVLGVPFAPIAAQAQYAFTTDNRSGVFAVSGGARPLIDDSGPVKSFLGDPHSSVSGSFTTLHAFLKNGGEGIFVSDGGSLKTIIDTSGRFAAGSTTPTLSRNPASTLLAVAFLWGASFLCRRRR